MVIEDLVLDTDLEQASSGITSDLEDHRLKAQTAHADVTKHLNQVLNVAIQIDRSHDNSLATSMALNQQNQVSLDCPSFLSTTTDNDQGPCLHAGS